MDPKESDGQVESGFQAKKNEPRVFCYYKKIKVCWEPGELEGPNLKISKFQNENPFLQKCREGPN